MARRRTCLPEFARRKLQPEGQQEDVSRCDGFHLVETFKVELPKTKAFATQLKTLGLTSKVLLVVGEEELDDNLILASRNMKDVLVVPTRYADPLCLLYFDKVVVTKAAVAEIEEMLA